MGPLQPCPASAKLETMHLSRFRPRPLVRLGTLLLTAAVAASCDNGPSGPGGNATEFVLEVRYLETAPTGATRTSFETAFTIVRETITGALTPVGIPSNFSDLEDCGPEFAGQPAVPQETIQGLVVYVLVTNIDGVGGTLGSAGPCLVRSESQRFLTALGVMRLDAADVANLQASDRLRLVVLHEMMHVLGFGTIWQDNSLITGSGTADARFVGVRARAACANTHAGGAPCATTVPVHSVDGPGSAYSHWRESLFTNELMTPFLNAGAAPFSSMSVESLGDLGYTVAATHTNAFTVSGTELRIAESSPSEPALQFSDPIRPVFTLDEKGALKPFRRVR